ncbi:MAG: GtrA family protein [Patescibacteria group bacterium]|nr:GtrA family protein [Patescibacteria group bacterium]
MDTKTQMIGARDYLFAAIIGGSFGLFSIPILKNIDLPFIPLNIGTYAAIVIFFAVFAVLAIWTAALIGKTIPVVFQFAKFSAIGAFNTFLDWGILNILIIATGIAAGAGYSIFKAFSFIIATFGSYFWNKHWAFQSKQKTSGKELGSFLLVSAIGMIINVSLASFIVISSVFDLSPERLANVGAAVATIASLLWNFIGYKFFVFKK